MLLLHGCNASSQLRCSSAQCAPASPLQFQTRHPLHPCAPTLSAALLRSVPQSAPQRRLGGKRARRRWRRGWKRAVRACSEGSSCLRWCSRRGVCGLRDRGTCARATRTGAACLAASTSLPACMLHVHPACSPTELPRPTNQMSIPTYPYLTSVDACVQLELPPNPLDDLIDQLGGPEKVRLPSWSGVRVRHARPCITT